MPRKSGAEARAGSSGTSRRTLALFQVNEEMDSRQQQTVPRRGSRSSESDRSDSEVKNGSTVVKKNPRWLASQEREQCGEKVRDRIYKLMDAIDIEEAKENPAMKRSILKDMRMELRKISMSNLKNIADNESRVIHLRRRLLKARRKAAAIQESVDEDEDEEEDGENARGGKQAVRHRRLQRRQSEISSDGSAFELNPTGQMSRPNPRAQSMVDLQSKSRKTPTWKKPAKNFEKIVKIPINAGYEFGKVLRKKRDKMRRNRRTIKDEVDANEAGASAAGEASTGTRVSSWGRRVDTVASAASSDSDNNSSSSGSVSSDEQVVRLSKKKGSLVIQGDTFASGEMPSSQHSLHDLRNAEAAVAKPSRSLRAKLAASKLLLRRRKTKEQSSNQPSDGTNSESSEAAESKIPELRQPMKQRLKATFSRNHHRGTPVDEGSDELKQMEAASRNRSGKERHSRGQNRKNGSARPSSFDPDPISDEEIA